jgi:hypothetical protein
MKKENKKNSSLEWEVIYAVIILYLFICIAILSMHYFHLSDQEVTVSSIGDFSKDARESYEDS